MQKAIEWVKENQENILDSIKSFLRIPSISAETDHESDVIAAAEWVKQNFERMGLETKFLPTQGYPIIYAATKIDPAKPTVLCYFHYDVQPEGNDLQWQYGAFEPTVFDDKLFGRGTTDDKMQGLIHAVALEAMLNSGEDLPVNFKFCIEGEEEISSPYVGQVLEENKELLACDYIVISDGPMLSSDTPSMEVGARGIVYTQIRVSVGVKDMHSGQFGGYVKNANLELVHILSQLKDSQGRVTIPGFYDGIISPTEEERKSWEIIDKPESDFVTDAGVFALDEGEKGYSLYERNWSRPTLDINGIWGGFTGEGAKTVIPFEARAKVSMRLVPGQDKDDIVRKFSEYLESFESEGVKVEVEWVEKAAPFLASPDDPVFERAREAYQEVYGKKALLLRTGGTIGLLADFQRLFEKPILMMNFGSPDENMHAPNEFMRIDNFWRGIEVSLKLWNKLSK